MRNLFVALVFLFFGNAVSLEAASISQTIAGINADAQKKDGPERVLKSISASTAVPVATLEKEKAKFGLSFGDLYVAHAITSAAGKKFDQIVGLKMKGQSWDKIAADNNVSLDGKKVKKDVANAKPTPAPKKASMSQPDTSGYKGMR